MNKKNIILIATVWIMVIAISFLWNYTAARKEQGRISLEISRSFFNQLMITRQWNANHGGLYVPVTEKTQPNPYIDVPMKNIEVYDSLKLTLVNPAYMTRQISEIAMEQEGVQFHITSLKPIRPQNKPTAREEKFLKEFERGVKEVGLVIREDSKTSFFYMVPLVTKKECLGCHAKQGYSEGDIRGGISVILPFTMVMPFSSLILGHVGIGLGGLFGIIVFGRRLTKAYETIKKQSMVDALTGIPNRRNFSETILREFKRSQREKEPLSVIMCDLDNFKAYNDSYGHSSGDLCLKKVAQMIKSSLKRPVDFCARYGGEEFVVILPNVALDGAMHVANKIRLNIEEMGIIHKKSLPKQIVTLSLGVATSEDANLISHEELIKNADMALYKSKEQGRNQVQSFSKII
jgi:diguanylate cyclase (GGDEF)-like protein